MNAILHSYVFPRDSEGTKLSIGTPENCYVSGILHCYPETLRRYGRE